MLAIWPCMAPPEPWTPAMAEQRPTDAIVVAQPASVEPEPWPEVDGGASAADDAPRYVLIALTTILVAGGCLYLLFRRGSIGDRARQDGTGADR